MHSLLPGHLIWPWPAIGQPHLVQVPIAPSTPWPRPGAECKQWAHKVSTGLFFNNATAALEMRLLQECVPSSTGMQTAHRLEGRPVQERPLRFLVNLAALYRANKCLFCWGSYQNPGAQFTASQMADGQDQIGKGRKPSPQQLRTTVKRTHTTHQSSDDPSSLHFPGHVTKKNVVFSRFVFAFTLGPFWRCCREKLCLRSCQFPRVATSQFCTGSQKPELQMLVGKLVEWQIASGTGFAERPSREMCWGWPSCLPVGEVPGLGDLSWSLSNHWRDKPWQGWSMS